MAEYISVSNYTNTNSTNNMKMAVTVRIPKSDNHSLPHSEESTKLLFTREYVNKFLKLKC